MMPLAAASEVSSFPGLPQFTLRNAGRGYRSILAVDLHSVAPHGGIPPHGGVAPQARIPPQVVVPPHGLASPQGRITRHGSDRDKLRGTPYRRRTPHGGGRG